MDQATYLSIGEELRRQREARKLSLEQAAAKMRMRQRYLTALETGDWSVFPSTTQARGFLRTYAGYLGLEIAELSELAEPESPVSANPSPEAPPASFPEKATFAAVGQKLRTQRELLGLSVEDVERHTRLRAHYLEALEAGEMNALPSPVQGRGMLKNYAIFLGLDPEPLLLRYADSLQARLLARKPRLVPRPPPRRGAPRRLFALEVTAGVLLVIALLTFMVWGALRIADLSAQPPQDAAAPSVGEVLGSGPTPTPRATPVDSPTPTAASVEVAAAVEEAATPTANATLESLNSAAVQVYVIAQQRAWMRVTVDGKVQFEGRVAPGGAYPYAADQKIELITGNGAALKVLYNRTDLGVLGSFGEVVERIFTVSGIQTPTATVTFTPLPPTATPLTSATPPGTPTLRP